MSMTHRDKVARLKFDADNDIIMNSAAVQLLFGTPVADPSHPSQSEIDSGQRRRIRYQNITGNTDSSIIDILTFYARQDNVTLVINTGEEERLLHTAVDLENLPDQAVIVDDDGTPSSVIDIGQMQADAVRFMYALAVTAGDDSATDQVAEQWARDNEPEYLGLVAAAALSFMTRYILAPTLDAAQAVGLDLRPGLARAAENGDVS